jgi:hypothetical protein
LDKVRAEFVLDIVSVATKLCPGEGFSWDEKG